MLPVDLAIAHRIGALADHARSQGCTSELADLNITAVVKNHEWAVLTSGTRHLNPLGVRTRNPFTALPPEVA